MVFDSCGCCIPQYGSKRRYDVSQNLFVPANCIWDCDIVWSYFYQEDYEIRSIKWAEAGPRCSKWVVVGGM
jgi:hypothetical protein